MHSEADLESVMESKLRENLQWSMLFFIFNFVCQELEQSDKERINNKGLNIKKDFFKNWKKHTCDHMVKKDLETINSILNSPKNIFYSILQNTGETIESTEIYQEKYNTIFKKIEEFYNHNISEPKK
jgi:CRISPR/Cas system CSM-associated protein Csm5 (group 7 of RAMP superfamily)